MNLVVKKSALAAGMIAVILSLLITAFNGSSKGDPSKYSEIRIFVTAQEQVKRLAEMGFYFSEAKREKNALVTVVNQDELAIIRKSGIPYEIIVEDVVEAFNRRPKLSKNELNALERQMKDTYGIEGFGFGSMAGFYTWPEIITKLDTMHLQYPNLTTAKQSIGTTIEGRPIYAMKISANPEVNDPTKPEALYTAMIHAREPQAMMTVMYYMYYLLENYGVDDEVTYLLDHRQLWFVPCCNPDGYEYNRTTNPTGGGQWRKNRRNNGDGSYGIDLNRNYGTYSYWNSSNGGSSTSPSSDTYRGVSPFSEPENQAIRDFCNARQFKTALNYHTYSNLLIYPWAWIDPTPTPDSAYFNYYSNTMVQWNGYEPGTATTTVGYAVRGSSDDWMYNDSVGAHPKILAMTPEVGTTGFWPSQSEIFPLAEENLKPNLFYSFVAGKYAKVNTVVTSKATYVPGDSGTIKIPVQNIGVISDISMNYDLTTNHTGITLYNTTGNLSQTQFREIDTIVIPFRLANDIPSSCAFSNPFTLTLDGSVIYRTAVSILVGSPTATVLSDNAETETNNWSTAGSTNGTWAKTASQSHSPSNSFTDSPSGQYLNNANAMMTLIGSLNCTNISGATFKFWERYDTESGYDYCNVDISTNGGSSWISLARYSGTNTTWHERSYDISSLVAGKNNVKIRFKLTSDGYLTADGWYVDDILITGYQSAPVVGVNDNETKPAAYSLSQNYPNPFNPSTVISYQLAVNSKVSLKIYNLLGQEVCTLVNAHQKAGTHSVFWDGTNNHGHAVSSGIYFYRLKAGAFTQSRKMLLVR